VTGVEQVEALGITVDDRARAVADACWPGGVTLILPAPGGVDGETTLGVRAPAHPVPLALLAETGPLPVSSANPHRFPECYSADDVAVAFAGAADLAAVIEGDSPGSIASSVLDLTAERPRLLRDGAVGRDRLEALVGPID
jgi:tRNA A37 threonylcarbamoyladenosine synthetase subunit TsaC/SUA5/YrdC